MKKHSYLTITCILLLIFAACKRESKITGLKPTGKSLNSVASITNGDSVSIDDSSVVGVIKTSYGFLKFETPEAYERILNTIKDYNEEQLNLWESTLNFTSSRTVYINPEAYGYSESSNHNTVMDDEIFHSIIDPRGIIQIGNYVFRAEINIDRVLEINITDYPANQEQFNAGIFNATLMNEMDSQSEPESVNTIFEHLDSGVKGMTKTTPSTEPTWVTTPIQKTPSDCGHFIPIGSNTVYEKQTQDMSDAVGTTYRADCKTVYQHAVFYFSLIGKMKYERKATSIWWGTKTDIFTLRNPNLGYWTACHYKPKKKGDEYPWPPHLNFNDRKQNTNELAWRAYEGGRRLDVYDMEIWFAYSDNCGQSSGVHVRTHN